MTEDYLRRKLPFGHAVMLEKTKITGDVNILNVRILTNN